MTKGGNFSTNTNKAENRSTYLSNNPRHYHCVCVMMILLDYDRICAVLLFNTNIHTSCLKVSLTVSQSFHWSSLLSMSCTHLLNRDVAGPRTQTQHSDFTETDFVLSSLIWLLCNLDSIELWTVYPKCSGQLWAASVPSKRQDKGLSIRKLKESILFV